jgi:hypothetical protein
VEGPSVQRNNDRTLRQRGKERERENTEILHQTSAQKKHKVIMKTIQSYTRVGQQPGETQTNHQDHQPLLIRTRITHPTCTDNSRPHAGTTCLLGPAGPAGNLTSYWQIGYKSTVANSRRINVD